MPNIWVDDTTQQAVDLNQVAAVEVEHNDEKGTISMRFDFIVSGFVHIKIDEYKPWGKNQTDSDLDEYNTAQERAAKYFNRVIAQWKAGGK